MLSSLPLLAQELVFSYLSVEELGRLRRVSRELDEAVRWSRLWYIHAKESYNVTLPSPPPPPDTCPYDTWKRASAGLLPYRHSLGRFRRALAKIELNFSRAGLASHFLPPMTCEAIAAWAEARKIDMDLIPLEVRSSLLVHGGQNVPESLRFDSVSDIMMGCFSFYDVFIAYLWSSLDLLTRLGHIRPFLIFPVMLTFGSGRDSLQIGVDAETGKLVALTRWGEKWIMANSWLEYVESYADNLDKQVFEITPEHGAVLFPRKNIPTLVTRGVGVSCSPIFVPSQSRQGQYLFTYSIRIFGTELVEPCKLVSRRWVIDKGDGGEPEVVAGAGVIGKYPECFPGSQFTYESACNTVGIGSMSGTFRFKSLVRGREGEEFDVEVPLFVLRPWDLLPSSSK